MRSIAPCCRLSFKQFAVFVFWKYLELVLSPFRTCTSVGDAYSYSDCLVSHSTLLHLPDQIHTSLFTLLNTFFLAHSLLQSADFFPLLAKCFVIRFHFWVYWLSSWLIYQPVEYSVGISSTGCSWLLPATFNGNQIKAHQMSTTLVLNTTTYYLMISLF